MKRVAFTAAVVLATLAALALLWRWRVVVLLFAASLAVASALRPMAVRLVESGWRGRLALGGAYFMFATGTIILAVSILDPLSENIDRLPREAAAAHRHVIERWPEGNRFQRFVASRMPSTNEVDDSLASFLGERPERWLVLTTVDAAGIVADVAFVIVLSLYWSLDRVHLERLWLSMAPVEQRAMVRDVWRDVEEEVGAYVRSEGIQTAAAVVLLGAGLYLVGHPYPALVACVGAVAWMIPWFGGPITVALAMATALPAWVLEERSLWPSVPAAGACAGIVLAILEFVVEPRFFDRRRYNSLFVILLAAGFFELFGWIGLILAPPAAAAIQIGVERAVVGRPKPTAVVTKEPVTQNSLRERLRGLRSDLAESDEPRPHVTSLIDRLEEVATGLEGKLSG